MAIGTAADTHRVIRRYKDSFWRKLVEIVSWKREWMSDAKTMLPKA